MRMNRLPRNARRATAVLHVLCAVLLPLPLPLLAQTPAAGVAPGFIYTCTDDHGRKLTSDRPMIECNAKEQRVLNKDGSLRTVLPPTLTADERAEVEARERKAAEARAAQAEAVRRDRNLMTRYRSESVHDAARAAALDSVRLAIKNTEARLAALARERKPLLAEAEFYKGKRMPSKLRAQIDANDAAVEAQRGAALMQEAELDRVNRLYDAELSRLQRLWAGAAPGSLGPLPQPGLAPATTANVSMPAVR
jgi:hypothetical protein